MRLRSVWRRDLANLEKPSTTQQTSGDLSLASLAGFLRTRVLRLRPRNANGHRKSGCETNIDVCWVQGTKCQMVNVLGSGKRLPGEPHCEARYFTDAERFVRLMPCPPPPGRTRQKSNPPKLARLFPAE